MAERNLSNNTLSDVEDETSINSELAAINARCKEMEEEAEKIKQLQIDMDNSMAGPTSSLAIVPLTLEEKQEIDKRSVYVGNVDYGASAEELESHFHGCGTINRVTILCNKFDGHPKGFAYIEFGSSEYVETALVMNESLFRGRQIKVMCKRTNLPSISTTNRYPRGGSRGRRGSGGHGPRAHRGSRRPTSHRGRDNYYSPY